MLGSDLSSPAAMVAHDPAVAFAVGTLAATDQCLMDLAAPTTGGTPHDSLAAALPAYSHGSLPVS